MARIEHRIGVAAPAHAVWSVVADLDRWAEWNPVYPEAGGKLAIGGRVHFKLVLPERAPMPLEGTVVDWVPNEQLIWRTALFGGLLRVTRYVEIEQLTETGCILSNGEIQGGLASRFVPKKLRGQIRAGMQSMNEALKARVEGAPPRSSPGADAQA